MSASPEEARSRADRERLADLFGPARPAVEDFARLLTAHGIERGLIGPGELPRLWERHLVNSAALEPFLPAHGSVADVGSGAGLPGIVLAAMRPELVHHLVEPMLRRVAWLGEVADELGLRNVVVHAGRAQDMWGRMSVDVVTARAVASLERLVPWTVPLLNPGGRLVLLKGRRAAVELRAAEGVLTDAGALEWGVHEVDPGGFGESTFVVEISFGSPVARARRTSEPAARTKRRRG